jgi:hypothetical protein
VSFTVKPWAAVVAIDIKRNEEKTKMGKPKWACASCGMYAGSKDRRQEISYLDIWKEEVLRESVRKHFRSQTKYR